LNRSDLADNSRSVHKSGHYVQSGNVKSKVIGLWSNAVSKPFWYRGTSLTRNTPLLGP
jgi:hypothetical protein